MKYKSSSILGSTELETNDDMNWRVQYPDMADKFKAMELRAEHQRLRSAVVGAAKISRTEGLAGSHEFDWRIDPLLAAIDALIAFEAEQDG